MMKLPVVLEKNSLRNSAVIVSAAFLALPGALTAVALAREGVKKITLGLVWKETKERIIELISRWGATRILLNGGWVTITWTAIANFFEDNFIVKSLRLIIDLPTTGAYKLCKCLICR